MKSYITKKLVKLVIFAMIMSMMGVTAMAEPVQRVDLGTFYVTPKHTADDPGEYEDYEYDDSDENHPTSPINYEEDYYDDDHPTAPINDEEEIISGEDSHAAEIIPGEDDPAAEINPDVEINPTTPVNFGEDDNSENKETESTSANNTEAAEKAKKNKVSGNRIAQAPATGDVITEKQTVVATKTKWRITPSFNVIRVSSSDSRAVKVKKKKDRSRSSFGYKWCYGSVTVKKPGTSVITLEGVNGEVEKYVIYAENPKINKDALTVDDVKIMPIESYVTGIKYLRPTAVNSKAPEVATVSENGSIRIKADGKTKITLSFGKRKVKGTVKAKLPEFTKKKVTLGSKPVKLTMKNVKDNSAVLYSSSDLSIVKMNKDGYAAPIANGTATVFGKSGNVVAECEVTVTGM